MPSPVPCGVPRPPSLSRIAGAEEDLAVPTPDYGEPRGLGTSRRAAAQRHVDGTRRRPWVARGQKVGRRSPTGASDAWRRRPIAWCSFLGTRELGGSARSSRRRGTRPSARRTLDLQRASRGASSARRMPRSSPQDGNDRLDACGRLQPAPAASADDGSRFSLTVLTRPVIIRRDQELPRPGRRAAVPPTTDSAVRGGSAEGGTPEAPDAGRRGWAGRSSRTTGQPAGAAEG